MKPINSVLEIDIETRSSVDIQKLGVYKYVEDPDFDVLLIGYARPGGEPTVIDVQAADAEHLAQFKGDLAETLVNPEVTKTAFNANFERICLQKWLGVKLPVWQWRCTKVLAAENGLLGSLEQVADFLELPVRKDKEGKRLINLFSRPKRGGGFWQPEDKPEDWKRFIGYCADDVRVEQAMLAKLECDYAPVSDFEQRLWCLDQIINDNGVLVDAELAQAAIELSEEHAGECMELLKAKTGLANPNSIQQLSGWLDAQGHPFETLGKETVDAAIASGELPAHVVEVLELRRLTAKASTKKYNVMRDAACGDGRVRGLFQFYGASTGRWAGRLLQVQNLPRGWKNSNLIKLAQSLVKNRDPEAVELLFESLPHTLKSIIRSGIVAPAGSRFIVSDFSAIEARVVAWYAGEEWVLDVFRGDGKIYEATAARMLGKPVEAVTPEDRQKGKIATLALGYQGAHGALDTMGAKAMGIDPSEYGRIVSTWRRENARIVALWHGVEASVCRALEEHRAIVYGRLSFVPEAWGLRIELPSGRSLNYHGMNRDTFTGGLRWIDTTPRGGYRLRDTYGGKLVENIVQATARDLLGEAMLRVAGRGYKIVMTVHDEVVVEMPECAFKHSEKGLDAAFDAELDTLNTLMAAPLPEWAAGLPMNSEGFVDTLYRKD